MPARVVEARQSPPTSRLQQRSVTAPCLPQLRHSRKRWLGVARRGLLHPLLHPEEYRVADAGSYECRSAAGQQVGLRVLDIALLWRGATRLEADGPAACGEGVRR